MGGMERQIFGQSLCNNPNQYITFVELTAYGSVIINIARKLQRKVGHIFTIGVKSYHVNEVV
jgi:hypothetical protein